MDKRFKVKPLMAAIASSLAAMTVASSAVAATDTLVISNTSSDIQVSSGESYTSITVTDTGVIAGLDDGIYNNGTITTITNNNLLGAGYYGIRSSGDIGAINNLGTLSSDRAYALYNTGTIEALNNSGTLSAGWGYTILNNGTINSINNSGTISAGSTSTNVLNNTGTIGSITNTGTIKGDIASSSSLEFIGGTDSTIGILTGYTADTDATVIGTINLSSGDLTFISGNMLLNDNVTLSSGSLNNSGANLYISNPITITGNYIQSANSSLNVNVASNAITTGSLSNDSGYGRLNVNGAVSLASGSSINLVNQGYAFAAGQRYVVINASDAANTQYNAGTLNYKASGYTGTVNGNVVTDSSSGDSLLVLNLSASQPPATSTTPTTTSATLRPTIGNAISSLNGLQKYSGVSDAGLLNLYNASLAINSVREANKAGEQLSPGMNASAANAASASTFDMLNVIGSRISTTQLAWRNVKSGIAAGDESLNNAVWGQTFGGRANQGNTAEMSGYKATYGGLVMGADRSINDNWRLGGALSYTSTNIKGNSNFNGSNAYVNSWGLTAYASYLAPDWYTNFYATAVTQRFKTQRSVDFSGYSGIANGKFDGQQYAVKAEFGYPLAVNQVFTVTPLANLSYSFMQQNGYTESNGNGAALRVDAAHSDAIKSGLGAKFEVTTSTAVGELTPYLQMLWYHQYDNQPMKISSSYAAAIDETGFITRGASPEKDTGDFSVGASLVHAGTSSITAYYGISAAPHYSNQSVSLRFKQLF